MEIGPDEILDQEKYYFVLADYRTSLISLYLVLA